MDFDLHTCQTFAFLPEIFVDGHFLLDSQIIFFGFTVTFLDSKTQIRFSVIWGCARLIFPGGNSRSEMNEG